MADVKISITIPGPVYEVLDAARKNNVVSIETVSEDGSKTITQRPKYASVEAQIADEMTSRFAPYAAEAVRADPAVKALEEQLANIQTQLNEKRSPAISVTKEDSVTPAKKASRK